MHRLYNLLPAIYRAMDDDAFLERFCDVMQARLESVYEDEAELREIQGIWTTRDEYLKYIARSLGWKLQAKAEEERRNECATIVDFYDLKGTPYAIRLILNLTLDKLFKKLGELYAPNEGSASEILVTPDDDLSSLLASEGNFVYDDWNENGGYEYHHDTENRHYSYIVFIVIDPDDYTYGEIRPRVKAFKNIIHTMHPAGRYCYPYFVCRARAPHHWKKLQQVYTELTGLKTLDDLGYLDDGGRLDENDEPIDDSISTFFRIEWLTLDDEGTLDDAGTLDDGIWECVGIFEIA